MAKRTDIKKVLIIGSGPIVIGQAAEFDYAGTQACLALKEEGYEVVLANSNPATIMTDTAIADKVYMEPLTLDYIAKILRYERPDAIVPGIGGQTGLNLVMQLERKGILRECGTKLLGTSSESIEKAEDRELFKEMCQSIGEPVIPSEITYDLEQAKAAAQHIGYPVVLRPAFTLGGTGGGFANNEDELVEIGTNAFRLSPVHQVLVEKSVKGYKEIEFEVMRDSNDTAITICGMENVDPVGVHTGDSIVVAPILSLSEKDKKRLNDSAIRIIRELKIEGGCNVQFALHPTTGEYYLIEVNPRVSRSSALASKASGYPIARVTAKIAMGMALEEIPVAGGTAAIEPSLDYIVAKFPRFPFDKFPAAPNTLGTQMKATGEVMGIGSTLEECFLKSVRSLETGVCHFYNPKFDPMTDEALCAYLSEFRDDNIYAVMELLRRGASVEKLHEITMITELFLESLQKIVAMEAQLKERVNDVQTLREAKKMGFSDKYISSLWNLSEVELYEKRRRLGILPVFRMVDTLHTGKYIAYLYSSYSGRNDSRLTDRKKIIVLGAGPIRIGQGVEFDYSTVHAVQTIKRAGFEAIIINNNPETVSTDYTTGDKLYFEPLTVEDVMEIINYEKPAGVIASLGGQTAINLAQPLMDRGVKIIGTDCAAMRKTATASRRSCWIWTSPSPRARRSRTSRTASGPRPRSATRCSCGRASCWAAGRWRSSPTRRCCATTSRPPWRSTRTSPFLSTSTSRARRSRSTRSVTGVTCSCPASWSSSSVPASTPATRSASIPPSPFPTRSRALFSSTPKSSVSASVSWASTISSSSWTGRRTSTSSKSIPAPRAPCPSSPRPPAIPSPTSPPRSSSARVSRNRGFSTSIRRKKSATTSRSRSFPGARSRVWTPT